MKSVTGAWDSKLQSLVPSQPVFPVASMREIDAQRAYQGREAPYYQWALIKTLMMT